MNSDKRIEEIRENGDEGPEDVNFLIDYLDTLQAERARVNALEATVTKWANLFHAFMDYLNPYEPVCDLDGGDIQDVAVKCGILEPVEVTERCGEACICAEWDDFPMTC